MCSASNTTNNLNRDGLKEYCEQTTLHGWLYLSTTTDRRFWRYAWTLVVLTSVGVASLFVYKASAEFTKATVVTTIHSTTEPLSEVYFPAVTVCNINQVSISREIYVKFGQASKKSFIRQAERNLLYFIQ